MQANDGLHRKRSATVLPLSSKAESDAGVETNNNNVPRARFYSISSDIIPQSLTHPDDDSKFGRSIKSPTDRTPSWSHVGFHSIVRGGGQRKSKQSLLSIEDYEDDDSSSTTTKGDKLYNNRYSSLVNRTHSAEHGLAPNNKGKPSGDLLRRSMESISSGSVRTLPLSLKGPKHSSFFSRPKDNSDKSAKLIRLPSTKSTTSLSNSLMTPSVPSKRNPLTKVARKLFQKKSPRHMGKDTIEPAIPTSLSKFLHSSYSRHRSQSHFIHNQTGGPIDSSRSVYSYNPSVNNDTSNMLGADESFTASNIMMLHELLKNLPSLEANYKNFSAQELHVLTGNVWNIYSNTIIDLFKNKGIWQLPAKIEDINRIFEFCIFLKTESKVACSHTIFLNEIEEFLNTSLYILENEIVFNYSNENTMNTLLKRLGIIWQIFYRQVFHDVMAVLLPLDKSIRHNKKYWMNTSITKDSQSSSILSLEKLLLRCFRDSIVLPYYQNFITQDTGISKSFQSYIFSEEEENDITEEDKLTLLQCFGILNSIKGSDKNQKIMEELLVGIRLSI